MGVSETTKPLVRAELLAAVNKPQLCHHRRKQRKTITTAAIQTAKSQAMQPSTATNPGVVLQPGVRVCVAWRRWRDLNPRWG